MKKSKKSRDRIGLIKMLVEEILKEEKRRI
jgi:hypothetical protein